MTLARQLLIGTTALFLILTAGHLAVTLGETRDLLLAEMEQRAQDTATSLGLSMSQIAATADTAQLDAMVNAIFDSGYYAGLTYQSVSGAVVIERSADEPAPAAPRWFIDWLDLSPAAGEHEVIDGWQIVGRLTISPNPADAHQDLWDMFVLMLWWFAAVMLIAYGLIGVTLRLMLRPLAALEAQALAISGRDFSRRVPLPRIREFRRLARASNEMSERLERLFEEQMQVAATLERESRQDALTGTYNRRHFDEHLAAMLDPDEPPASVAIALLQLQNFAEFNSERGFVAGDALLSQVSEALAGQFDEHENCVLARRGGADFALCFASVTVEQARAYLERAFQAVMGIAEFREGAWSDRVHAGMVYAERPDSAKVLLSQADHALRTAQASGTSGHHFDTLDASAGIDGLIFEANQWRQLIGRAIEEDRIEVRFQPVVDTSGAPLFYAALARLVDEQNRLVPAATFMPMADRFQLSAALDRRMAEQVFALPDLQDPAGDTSVCLNLTTQTLADAGYRDWLLETLRRDPGLAGRTVLELPAHAASSALEVFEPFAHAVTGAGARVSLDGFSLRTTRAESFRQLPLAYLKLERAFVTGIDGNPENQYYVQALLAIAHGLDCALIAKGIETQDEWDKLRELGIDGGLGYFLGAPHEALRVEPLAT